MLREGGLWCDAERLARRLGSVGIAHQHIKERRARKVVPVASGGTLADYVPFYFAPRSPMLFAIHKGAVEDYRESQREILHLVSSIDAVQPGGSDLPPRFVPYPMLVCLPSVLRPGSAAAHQQRRPERAGGAE